MSVLGYVVLMLVASGIIPIVTWVSIQAGRYAYLLANHRFKDYLDGDTSTEEEKSKDIGSNGIGQKEERVHLKGDHTP